MKALVLTLFFLMTSGGSCEGESFDYEDNTRVIATGRLLDEAGNPLINQQVNLVYYKGYYDNTDDIYHIVFSDSDGKFFVSAPGANKNCSLFFSNKKIISLQNSYELTIYPFASTETSVVYLTKKTYEFGNINLKPIE